MRPALRIALQRCARSAGIAARSTGLALALGQAVLAAAASAAAHPAPAPGAPLTSPRTDEARLLFLGDITLGRYVGAAITAHGADAPFDRARAWLSAADVTVANLEGPLVPPGAMAVPPPSPGLLNLTGSTASAGALARAGFDVLSVANNHSLDAGEAGLRHTRRALTGVGIVPVGLRAGAADGVGAAGAVGQMPVIKDVRGIRIAVLAYTLVLNPPIPPSRAAAAIAYIDPAIPADIARAVGEVQLARSGSAAAVEADADADADADANADIVAVILHWGTEYAARPSAGQQRIARALAAAGADIVVGAHPHVVQGVEVLGGVEARGVETLRHATLSGAPTQPTTTRPTLVAYSLGNALFDQGGDAATRRGAALEVGVGTGGVEWARLIPLANVSGPHGYRMQPLSDIAGRDVLRRAAAGTGPALQWHAIGRDARAAPVEAIAYRRSSDAVDHADNNPDAADAPDAPDARDAADAPDVPADADDPVERTPRDTAGRQSAARDLGLGRPTRVDLAAGRLAVRAIEADGTWSVVWQTQPGWHVDGYAVGDADADGAPDVIYWLHKPALTWSRPPGGGMRVLPEGGALRPHLFVEGWRRGAMRPVWHGSPRPGPVLAAAVAPIGAAGRPALVTLEADGAPATRGTNRSSATGTVRVWTWTGGFGFELVRAVAGVYAEMWPMGDTVLVR